MIRRLCALLLAALATAALHAAIDPDEFDDDAQRARYQQFIADLRCPKCQNQNLAGSDAPIATDLRKELRRLLKEGQSDRQIVDFMVARYGDFILYKPPFDRHTAVLWLAPVALFGVGAVAVGVIVRRHRRSQLAAPAPLDAAERAQLAALLSETESGDETAADGGPEPSEDKSS